jgi:branched-chain amino acid transport system ATP-binding protein
MLKIENIHIYYGESHILQGLSLDVTASEVVAVLGRNGVGKTTLLSSIVGFTPARDGRMRFVDRDILGLSPERIAKLGIGLVPQGRRVFPSLTVGETLTIALRPADGAVAGRSWSVERVYQAFPRLHERRNHRALTLSGGEQQMLATGRALVGNPRLVLLDEPTEGLSPLLVRELETVLRQLKNDGVTILVVEQRINFALALADRVYLMSKGTIAEETTPDVLRADAAMRLRYLGV